MKKLIFSLVVFISTSYSMDLKSLKAIINESPSKSCIDKMKIFSKAGVHTAKISVKIHSQNNTINLPKTEIISYYIGNKYLVSKSPMSDNTFFYYVTNYDEKKNIYKRWSISPEGKVTTFVGIAKKRVVSWFSLKNKDGIQEMIIEDHSDKGINISSISYKNGKLDVSVEANLIVKP